MMKLKAWATARPALLAGLSCSVALLVTVCAYGVSTTSEDTATQISGWLALMAAWYLGKDSGLHHRPRGES